MHHKKRVNLEGTHPAIFYALGRAEEIYIDNGQTMVVTSVNDSHENKPLSLHRQDNPKFADNLCRAADLRTNHVPSDIVPMIFRDLVKALNPIGFDVVLHADEWDPVTGKQTMFQHFHIEYDPKGEESWSEEEV